ncbi:MAG: guanylate kinase [Thermomicrobiales bacterium]
MSTPVSNLATASTNGLVQTDPMGLRADEAIAELRSRRRPRLFVISGPSGVGKDTVVESLRAAFPDVYFAVTATTRERRPGEIDGVHYYFMDTPTFEANRASGEFMEWAQVYGNLYGVPKGQVRLALARGQDVIVKVDVQGAATIRQLTPDGCFIFLAPESMTELLRRLRSRKSEDTDVLMERFQAASREMPRASEFDYVVFNETERVERAADSICAIVSAERCRVDQPEILI